jgi:DNA-binding CsgD family transcriptional regulator
MPLESFLGAILNGEKNNRKANDIIPSDSIFGKEIREWMQFFDKRPHSFCHVIPAAFIFNYHSSTVTYISPSIAHLIGYENKVFLGKNGMVKFIDLIHPNDFKIYNEQIFPKEMGMLSSVAYERSSEFIFSTTLRINQLSGSYKTLLMKKGFVLDEEKKMPVYEFGILLDISAIKRELSITHTIERFWNEEDCASYSKVSTEDYFPEMDATILSSREKEILTNLSLGIKRKDVGAKLYISDNTVANHIKTILRKTNSKNVREAIAICKMNGVI